MAALTFEPAAAAVPAAPAASPQGKRDYISFSAIRTYQSCPLRYFFKYVAGLPEATTAASLVFGSAIHRAIEHHFRELLAGCPPPSLLDLMAAYREEWTERKNAVIQFAKGDDQASLERLAERMLAAFAASSTATPSGQVVAVEEQLRGPVIPGLPDLLGRVDLIVESPTELVISDWKTSRSRWSQAQVEESAEQLLLYTELARDFAPGKRLRIEFTVLTKAKEVAVERHALAVDPVRVDRTKRVIERVFAAIAGGHFYPAPSPMACPSCPFRGPCGEWRG